MLQEFSLENIAALDNGRVQVAFQQALSRVLNDLVDRPGADETRKVLLQMECKPVCSEDGDLEDVSVTFQVKDTIPTRKSKKYSMDVRRKSAGEGRHVRQLVFNDMSDENVNQTTMYDGEES